MGIAVASLAMLMVESKKRPFAGSVLQIGRQDIYFNYETLVRCAAKLGVKLHTPDRIDLKPNEWVPGVQTIDDRTFFKALGFDVVHSIDASDYEKPDHVHDFNTPISPDFYNRYDLVLDGGSLEHMFHLPNALANMTALTNVGGRIIHHSPTHNFVDHGFYSFSPTFFYDYYEANHFAGLDCHLLASRLPFQHNVMPKLYKYTPGMLEAFSVGGVTKEKFDGCEMLMTVFTATKTAESTGHVVPIQRRYQQWWANAQAKKAALSS